MVYQAVLDVVTEKTMTAGKPIHHTGRASDTWTKRPVRYDTWT